MSRTFPWDVLGIEETDDRKAIRSAYAARLKTINPDEDIEGFTELRDARDVALRMAKQGTPANVPPSTPNPDADSYILDADPWQPQDNALPADDFGPDYGARAASEDASRTPLGAGWDDAAGEVASVDTNIGDPLGGVDATGEGDVGIDMSRRDDPWDETTASRFLDILFPANQYTDAELTVEEYDEALDKMRTIIAQAQAAPIDRQGGIEDWLAHYLASGWPRSGPLVEEAVETFGWDREAGRLDEHAPIAFLNARLGSLNYLQELENPDHQWHKAYVELRKPGPRSKWPGFRRSDDEINGFLFHIREHYPELEAHLDGTRVASYVEPDQPGHPAKGWLIGFGLYLIFSTFMGFVVDRPDRDAPPVTVAPPPIPTMQTAWTSEERTSVIEDLFGTGVSYDDLTNELPVLVSRLSILSNNGTSPENAVELARNDVRRLVLASAGRAPFEELVAVKQHELNLIRWLRDNEGADACGSLPAWLGGTDAFQSSTDLIAADRQLARRLLEAGLLAEVPSSFPTSAPIPGEVVEAVMERTGMSEAQFTQAAQGNASPAAQCAYRVALLEVILRRPGSVSADLLRIG